MENIRSRRGLSWPLFIMLLVIAGALGAFSLFVGYNKALAPLAVLREHSAWTIHLPVLLGRVIGWAEIASAVVLILGLFAGRLARWGSWAAVWITANHMVAAVVHVIQSEWHTLTQSAVVIALCLLMVWLYRRRAQGAH
jgi:uncharacterized membrane protein (UPF0136 family)